MSEQNQNAAAGSSKNVLDFINFPRGAIGKRGLPATRNARLPSIRNPRDLTLGGLNLGITPKRTFAPKIPVRREKSQDSGISPDKGKPKNVDSPHDRRKGGTSERGRGRGRNRPEYIQTDGIFSEGIGGAVKKPSRSRVSNELDDAPRIPRLMAPVIKKEITEENNDKVLLDNLLRDDFIDDGSDEEKDVQCPVYLPLSCSTKDKLGIKNDPGDVKNVINIKKEKLEIKTEEPSPMELLDVKPNLLVKTEPSEACELFTAEDITEDKQLLFFQFPDVLGVPPQPEDSRSQPKNSQDSSTSQETAAPNSDGIRLADFPEGYIGKLQVLKSGKTRLVLGSLVLDVKMGAPFSTLQDLVSVRTGMSGGDMTVLGHVHHKLVCMPDVENLMAQCAL